MMFVVTLVTGAQLHKTQSKHVFTCRSSSKSKAVFTALSLVRQLERSRGAANTSEAAEGSGAPFCHMELSH